MKVQIYTIQSIEEAESLLNLGVDNIGLTPASIGLPGEITVELAKAIFTSVKSSNNIALSVSNNINEILNKLQSDIKTLEKAVYSGSINFNSENNDNYDG